MRARHDDLTQQRGCTTIAKRLCIIDDDGERAVSFEQWREVFFFDGMSGYLNAAQTFEQADQQLAKQLQG